MNSSLNRGWTIGANYTTLINTIHCWAEDEDGNRMMVSVLPDSGAQQNVAHRKQLKPLNLKSMDLKDEARLLSGVEGGIIRLNLLSKLKLISLHSEENCMEVPVFLIDQPGQWFASIPKVFPRWMYQRKTLADPRILEQRGQIPLQIILDCDYFNKLTSSGMEYRKDGIVLRETPFGEIASGKYIPEIPEWAFDSGGIFPAYTILNSEEPELLTIFGDEEVGQKVEWHHATDAFDIYGSPYSSELEADTTETEFLEAYISQLKKLPDGRIEAPLIINPNFRGTLTTNEHLSKPRHERNLRVITQQDQESQGYKKAMDDIISMCCEPVTDTYFEELKASGRNWCKLPIHPVLNPDSTTTPIRPVMDASACEKGCQSLNKYLLAGPNIMPLLQHILRRFQVTPMMMIADIKKAFLQVSIREEERDLLLVDWWTQLEDGTWKSCLYRFHRLPWGLISAPFILNAVIRFLYKEYAALHPEYSTIIADLCISTYVDDILAFGTTSAEIKLKIWVAREALKPGQFLVTKLRSHPREAADELMDEFGQGGESTILRLTNVGARLTISGISTTRLHSKNGMWLASWQESLTP